MAKTAQNSFADITERMDAIIATVRSKDTSLERSLDLFDEAIALGSRAVELVDNFDMSPDEAAQLDSAATEDEQPSSDDSEASATEAEESSAPSETHDASA